MVKFFQKLKTKDYKKIFADNRKQSFLTSLIVLQTSQYLWVLWFQQTCVTFGMLYHNDITLKFRNICNQKLHPSKRGTYIQKKRSINLTNILNDKKRRKKK